MQDGRQMSNTRTATTRRAPTAAARARAARQSKPAVMITYKGKEYRVADKIGVWPLMQFSNAAESGLTLGEQKGLAALYAMLQDVIHEDDWGRFQDDMRSSKNSDLTGLMGLANQAVELLTEQAQKTTSTSNGKAITATAEQA
jgi:hypothetical protein